MADFELVLPCYNESRSLEFIVERAAKGAESLGLTSDQFQLVLVENGSADDSLKKMQTLKSGPFGKWFRIVEIKKNEGYGNGIWTGLQTTNAPIVGYSHSDAQCDPTDALKAYFRVKESPKLVKGVRVGRSFQERIVSRVFEVFTLIILQTRLYEINAQPKVFPRALLPLLEHPPKDFSFDLYVLYQAKRNRFPFETITVEFPPRVHGVSNWASSFFSRYKTILSMIRYMYRLRRGKHACSRS